MANAALCVARIESEIFPVDESTLLTVMVMILLPLWRTTEGVSTLLNVGATLDREGVADETCVNDDRSIDAVARVLEDAEPEKVADTVSPALPVTESWEEREGVDDGKLDGDVLAEAPLDTVPLLESRADCEAAAEIVTRPEAVPRADVSLLPDMRPLGVGTATVGVAPDEPIEVFVNEFPVDRDDSAVMEGADVLLKEETGVNDARAVSESAGDDVATALTEPVSDSPAEAEAMEVWVPVTETDALDVTIDEPVAVIVELSETEGEVDDVPVRAFDWVALIVASIVLLCDESTDKLTRDVDDSVAKAEDVTEIMEVLLGDDVANTAVADPRLLPETLELAAAVTVVV